MHGRVLIVDDDRNMCELVQDSLDSRGFDTSFHLSAQAALAALKEEEFEVVVTDLQMPGMDGIDLCVKIADSHPSVSVVVMTSFGSMETAVRALRAGAYDYVTKPIEMDMLALTLARAIDHRDLQQQVKTLTDLVARTGSFESLIGECAPMREIFDLITRIGDSEASVLVTGESGTGKELVARALHRRSRRHDAPFVAVNCAALPENLLESELFGHTRGAFTDARNDRKGLFLQADGGSLFLDELGALPLPLQPKLLRALEQRTVRAIGSDKEVPFDVRLIAATNSDLESAVESGQFREDLYFRINVIQLEVPPLRARGSDILLLAQHFLEQLGAGSNSRALEIPRTVAEKLLAYDWPGNVRELRNAIEHASVLARHDKIIADDLPRNIRDFRSSGLVAASGNPAELPGLVEVERRYIEHVMRTVSNNRTLAARILGIDRKTLYRKLSRYDESGR